MSTPISLTEIEKDSDAEILGQAHSLHTLLSEVPSEEQLPAIRRRVARFAAGLYPNRGLVVSQRLLDLLEDPDALRTYRLREEIGEIIEDEELGQIVSNAQSSLSYILLSIGERRLQRLLELAFPDTTMATARRWLKNGGQARYENAQRLKGLASSCYFLHAELGSCDAMWEWLKTPSPDLSGGRSPLETCRFSYSLIPHAKGVALGLRGDPLRDAAFAQLGAGVTADGADDGEQAQAPASTALEDLLATGS